MRMLSAPSARRAAASALQGCAASEEKAPALNMWKLATPRPSERLYTLPVSSSLYFHAGPAPASSKTLTWAKAAG